MQLLSQTAVLNRTQFRGTITSVSYYSNGTLIGTAVAAPWTFTWGNVGSGSYLVTAVAKDNFQATTTSEAVRVVVGNFPPIVTGAAAATGTRTSAFAYDPNTGLLIKEIIEPQNSALCLVTEYLYNHLYHENTDSVGGWHQRLAVRSDDGTLLYGASFGMTNADDPNANPLFDNFFASGKEPALGNNGNGAVYEDSNPVTTQVQNVFKTTPAEDRWIINYLKSIEGQTAPYNACTNSCRTWSSKTYDYLVREIEKLRSQKKAR